MKSRTKHDRLRKQVETLLEDGHTIIEIAEATGIPKGSMHYVLGMWGLHDKTVRHTGRYSENARKSWSSAYKEIHRSGKTSGENHWSHGKMKVRGEFVSLSDGREELERYVKADLTLADMSEAMGVDRKTITNWLRRFDLQQGIRSGERCSWYHGGWRKGRGPDWGEIRERILNRDGYKCRLCGMSQEEAKDRGHTLSIHHIVPWEVSHDNSDDNLIALCQSCHMKEEWRSGVWSADYTPLHV